MSTIAEQLAALAQVKSDIKAAIIAKGVSVSDSDPFSSYATKIGQISGGGGDPFVEKWDFTSGSLTGENGTAVTLGGSASITAGVGVSFTTGADRVNMPTYMLKTGRKIDIEFGTMERANVNVSSYIMAWSTLSTSDRCIIGFRPNMGYWIVENPTVYNSYIQGENIFSNSKFSMIITADSKIHLYKDDVLWWEPNATFEFSGLNFWVLGTAHNNYTFRNAIIRKVTISEVDDQAA